MIITYSPKYATYQKTLRQKQLERAEKMVTGGKVKKQRKNPNDPARFIGKVAVTKDGEVADIEEQGFMPLYKRDKLTDALHDKCGFRTDYQFITKQSMKTIQKHSKNKP